MFDESCNVFTSSSDVLIMNVAVATLCLLVAVMFGWFAVLAAVSSLLVAFVIAVCAVLAASAGVVALVRI
jgi:hypothetical protein